MFFLLSFIEIQFCTSCFPSNKFSSDVVFTKYIKRITAYKNNKPIQPSEKLKILIASCLITKNDENSDVKQTLTQKYLKISIIYVFIPEILLFRPHLWGKELYTQMGFFFVQ